VLADFLFSIAVLRLGGINGAGAWRDGLDLIIDNNASDDYHLSSLIEPKFRQTNVLQREL